MAITKEKKQAVVEEVSQLLSGAKMTVIASYQGTPVKAMQNLRRQARDGGTTIKVVKNRLVRKALDQDDKFKAIDSSVLTGQLLYAFNSDDEVAPAQGLDKFAKTNPSLQFIGAITGEGGFLTADEVKALAGLPGKNQLIAEVVATLLSPVNDVTSALSGNLHALLDGIEAKVS